MVGVVIGVSTAVFTGIEELGRRKPVAKPAGATLLVMIIISFTGTTIARNAVWRDKITLWTDTVEKSPDKMRAHYCLANAYMDQGLIDKAIIEYNRSLRRVWDDYHQSHYNLGNAYRSLGMIPKAIEHYRAAIAIMPNFPIAQNNLGNTYASMGNIDEAIKHYQTAISLDPDYYQAYSNLGNVYAMKGMYKEAIQAYERSLQLDPYYEDARYNLSVVRRMRERGRVQQ
jgi:tetratricopeptide (TPR) repeat protein